MNIVARIYLTIIGLSLLAGAADAFIYFTHDYTPAAGLEFVALLVVTPLAHAFSFVPGLVAGYRFGARHLMAAATAGAIAYFPYQAIVGGTWLPNLAISFGAAIGFSLYTVVCVLAGAQLAQLWQARRALTTVAAPAPQPQTPAPAASAPVSPRAADSPYGPRPDRGTRNE